VITIHGPTVGTQERAGIHLNDVQAEIGADDAGGFVRIAGADGIPALFLGHVGEQQSSGLFATDQHGDLLAAAKDGEAAEVWGATLSWENVPNSHRDFQRAEAGLRSEEGSESTDDEFPDTQPPEPPSSE
jgi:hypothetical protein